MTGPPFLVGAAWATFTTKNLHRDEGGRRIQHPPSSILPVKL
jgi:hypothetical protein